MKNRITIVGDGNVGSSIALTLLLKEFGDEIVLIDKNQGKAKADSLDLLQASVLLHHPVLVRPGDETDYRDSTFIILTAAAGSTSGVNDRLLMLEPTRKILSGILASIRGSGFNGYLIVVSNPVDVMTYYAYKKTGLSRSQVIGTGTLLDTARLVSAISEEKKVPASDIVDGMMLGEHGKTSAGIFSNVFFYGKEESISFSDAEKEAIVSKTNDAGWEIVSGKGNTSYGIAASVYRICHSIYYNENCLLPVSQVDEEGSVAYSLPRILNRKGIDRTVEFSLSEEEKKELDHSIEALKEVCRRLS